MQNPAAAQGELALSAAGADPCGPQPKDVEQPLTPEREMAERFQPRLLMSSKDGVAVRRDPSASSFREWRIGSEQKAEITVYAACIARQQPIEATFAAAEIVPGRALRVDDRGAVKWRLMDGSRVVAEATPQVANEAKDRPNARNRAPSTTICRRSGEARGGRQGSYG